MSLFTLIKLVAKVATIGGVGTFVPYVTRAYANGKAVNEGQAQQLVSEVKETRSSHAEVRRVQPKQEYVVTKGEKNRNRALDLLKVWGCKLALSEENSQFDALYVCEADEDEAEVVDNKNRAFFYYLGKKETFEEDGVYSPDKVKSVKFKQLSEGGADKAQLILTMAEGKTAAVSLPTYKASRWQYFDNMVPEESCFFETAQLGGEMLRCNLAQGGSYNFWI